MPATSMSSSMGWMERCDTHLSTPEHNASDTCTWWSRGHTKGITLWCVAMTATATRERLRPRPDWKCLETCDNVINDDNRVSARWDETTENVGHTADRCGRRHHYCFTCPGPSSARILHFIRMYGVWDTGMGCALRSEPCRLCSQIAHFRSAGYNLMCADGP